MQMDKGPILILGGTHEARKLAEHLTKELGNNSVISSLSGATENPKSLPGKSRIGGFGGAEKFGEFLLDNRVIAVIDATHPFAERISVNAITACRKVNIPLISLQRKPWQKHKNDNWIVVRDLPAAVDLAPNFGLRVFLSLGPRAISYFSRHTDLWFLVRVIDAPEEPIKLKNYKLVLGRGPFNLEDELNLLKRNNIDLLITRNSGGEASYAKILAARKLSLPVVIIKQPININLHVANSLDDTLNLISSQLGRKI